MEKKLKEKIIEDFKEAFKKKKEILKNTLKGLLAVIKNEEIKNHREFLEDSQIIHIVLKEIKKRKEAIELYKQGQREDLVKKENEEMEILQKYLPKMLSLEEIRKIVKKAILDCKDDCGGCGDARSCVSTLGKVMKKVMEQVKDQADGSEVNKIVKEELQVISNK